MKFNLNIECQNTNEAKAVFKALADMVNIHEVDSLDVAETPKGVLVTSDDEPITPTVAEVLAEVKAEADKATIGTLVEPAKRTRPSRAKAPVAFTGAGEPITTEDAPVATGSDEPVYDITPKATEAPKTIEDVRILAKALMGKGHNARLQAEMTKLGATRLSEVKDYDEAFAVLSAISKELNV